MIKDTQQKLKAIRYCVALDIVPYLEVVVRHSADTARTPTDITDIDVLGIQPAGSHPGRRVFFDCKSGQKMSAINRALWAGGLRAFINADESFVILARSAPHGHRLAANELGIRIFSEELFDVFALAASKDYAIPSSYLEQISAWNALAKIGEHFPPLRDLLTFLCSHAPLEGNCVTGLRGLVSHLKRAEGELDPSKSAHRAIFFLIVAQALIYLSAMARSFHNVFDPRDDITAFEDALRYFVWGGKEAYELRQKLNSALKASRGAEEVAQFEFPGWATFVEMFRGFLDAPFSLAATCLPVKDLGFRELSSAEPAIDLRLAKRLQANNRIRQFAIATAGYLVSASRLPREFKEHLSDAMKSVLSEKTPT